MQWNETHPGIRATKGRRRAAALDSWFWLGSSNQDVPRLFSVSLLPRGGRIGTGSPIGAGWKSSVFKT